MGTGTGIEGGVLLSIGGTGGGRGSGRRFLEDEPGLDEEYEVEDLTLSDRTLSDRVLGEEDRNATSWDRWRYASGDG